MSQPRIRALFSVQQASDVRQRVPAGSTTPGEPGYGEWEVRKVHEDVVLGAVYESGSPKAERVRFAKSTPSGSMTMRIDNPDAWGLLVPGDELYVDLTPAPPRCSACKGQGRTYGDKTWTACGRCGETGREPDPA